MNRRRTKHSLKKNQRRRNNLLPLLDEARDLLSGNVDFLELYGEQRLL